MTKDSERAEFVARLVQPLFEAAGWTYYDGRVPDVSQLKRAILDLIVAWRSGSPENIVSSGRFAVLADPLSDGDSPDYRIALEFFC